MVAEDMWWVGGWPGGQVRKYSTLRPSYRMSLSSGPSVAKTDLLIHLMGTLFFSIIFNIPLGVQANLVRPMQDLSRVCDLGS